MSGAGNVETLTISAPRDPCGDVFAPENKAAGGTSLEWAHYYACQAEQYIVHLGDSAYATARTALDGVWADISSIYNTVTSAPSKVYDYFSDTLTTAGNDISAWADGVQQRAASLLKWIQDQLAELQANAKWILIGGALLIGGIVFLPEIAATFSALTTSKSRR